ncbi:FAD-binding oxidoreductase [Limibaculum sp. FT325]|uniref:NAD(P)/FAD-dependent oxidoreductase n=1 Tax=Thermohalobaculum sediminis TaxID=2939436 RepID=UPI0020BF3425|nr:FAD-dependent oxidoreductase [Limibaculum sediminis]MCL5776279.1 FAD-binding oxidoreductase [Limibaculum sediminis]
MNTADVIVIGGGIHGCSTALHCRLRGLSVVVVEKDHVARHASGVNAGGVRRLNRHPAEIPLAMASAALWQRIEDLVHDDCGYRQTGQIRVAEGEPGLAAIAARRRLVEGLGYSHEQWIGPEELFELVPAISRHCLGALWTADDGHADPTRTTRAFARQAAALGAEFLTPCRAGMPRRAGGGWQVPTDRGTFSGAQVVNCAGAWGGAVAAALGEPVPIEPIAPMMLVTARMAPFVDPVVASFDRMISFKQSPNGSVVIGGGWRSRAEPDANRAHVEFGELHRLIGTTLDLFPVMRGARIVRSWAGIEGAMPDAIPVIGPSMTAPGVIHAFGFSAHGFQLGPIGGAIVADLVESGATSLPIEPFSIARFAGQAWREAS